MSYLHCPACQRAYNIAAQASCPYCPVHATPVDPTEDIVAAAESLARAMSRATPSERDAAADRMARLALPEHAGRESKFTQDTLRSIRTVLVPPPPPPPKPRTLLSFARRVADRMIEKLETRREPKLLMAGLASVRERASAYLARL